jgi:hypothetical protein
MDEYVDFVIPVHTEDLLQDASGSNRLAVVDDVRVASLGAANVKKLLDGEAFSRTHTRTHTHAHARTHRPLKFHVPNGYFFFFFFFSFFLKKKKNKQKVSSHALRRAVPRWLCCRKRTLTRSTAWCATSRR